MMDSSPADRLYQAVSLQKWIQLVLEDLYTKYPTQPDTAQIYSGLKRRLQYTVMHNIIGQTYDCILRRGEQWDGPRWRSSSPIAHHSPAAEADTAR